MDHKYHRAALIPQLINAYGEWVENYGSSGSRVGVLGNFRGLEACM